MLLSLNRPEYLKLRLAGMVLGAGVDPSEDGVEVTGIVRGAGVLFSATGSRSDLEAGREKAGEIGTGIVIEHGTQNLIEKTASTGEVQIAALSVMTRLETLVSSRGIIPVADAAPAMSVAQELSRQGRPPQRLCQPEP